MTLCSRAVGLEVRALSASVQRKWLDSSQRGVTEGQVTTLRTVAPWSLGVRGWQVSMESPPGIGASGEALRRGWLS